MRLFSSLILATALAGLPLLCQQSEDTSTSKEKISRIRDLSRRKADAIPALSAYLSDRDREVRIEAVRAITRVGGQDSLPPLVKATKDNDSDVQGRAVDGLVNFYLPGYVAQGLTGPLTRGVRSAKSFVVSRNDQIIDATVQVEPEVLEAVRDAVAGGSSTATRISAARAAGILRDRPAIPALSKSMRAHDNALIFESLIAVQKIKDKAAGPAVSGVTHDLDERTQLTALETVGILRSTESAPDVRSALANARNIKVKRAAVDALAMLGLPKDRQLFQQNLENSDVELRVSALEGLGRIREPEDVPALQKAYDETNADWRVHLAAAFALVNQGRIETKEYAPLPYLVENIAMKSRATVASAYLAEAARREDVRKAMTPMIAQSSRYGKLNLISVLAESGDTDVEPVLNELTRDRDAEVATAAAKALRTIKARLSS